MSAPLRFTRQLALPVSARDAYRWHARSGAFARLAPPWQRLEIVRPAPIEEGSRLIFKVRQGPVAITWEALHVRVEPDRSFSDVQVRGPFAAWAHEHRFEDVAEDRCVLIDDVRYRLPGGRVGRCLGRGRAESELDSLFRYRHSVTRDDLRLHSRFEGRPLRVAIAGAGGLIGRTLAAVLGTGGYDVIRLVRRAPREPARDPGIEVPWWPETGAVDAEGLGEIDALVYLAGTPILGRWTRKRRRSILDSRADALERLGHGLERAGVRPRVVIAASGVGIYGTEVHGADESRHPGSGFLARVAIAAEDALVDVARRFDARHMALRLGVVLDPRGGYLKEILPSARLGLGAIIGRGERRVPWVSLEDVADAIVHGLRDDRLTGPVNVVAPASVTQAELTRALGRVLGRPTPVRLPTAAFRLALGQFARETLLADQDVRPAALERIGVAHRWPTLEPALAHVLGRSTDSPTTRPS